MGNPLLEIKALGQSVWLDNISRDLIDSGSLAKLIADDGISGVTSNPTIFEKAIGHSAAYDAGLAAAAAKGLDARGIFFELAYRDIRDGAKLLRPTWDAANAQDGHISFELPPELAHDAAGSIEAGKRIFAEIGEPNVLIKVPGTVEGVEAFRELTAAGVPVNVTLLFSVGRYREIAQAWIDGLERLSVSGGDLAKMASVASFFVSRVDGKVDAKLLELRQVPLSGRAAIANAKLAYRAFREICSGPRWEALAAKGASVQRPLWASTSTKNPAYKDTLYVDSLIGPHTVNTMPDATVTATRDHGVAAVTVDQGLRGDDDLMQSLLDAGVDMVAILDQLVVEGVASFQASFDTLIATIEQKASALAAAPHA